MKTFLIFLSCIVAMKAQAESIQVPENCAGKLSPCLVRTEESGFEFVQSGYKIRMLKQTIVKLNFENEKLNLDLIEGQVKINSGTKHVTTLTLHGQDWSQSAILYVKREASSLGVLRLDDFKLAQYNVVTGAASSVEKLKSEFITKSELIDFTRTFFGNTVDYRKFLTTIQRGWKTAFERENNSQTKVLLRSVASVDEAAQAEAARKLTEAKRLKKVREEFFYRTFER